MEQRWVTVGSVLWLPALLSLPRQAVTFTLPPSAVSSEESGLEKGLLHLSAACAAPGLLCCCLSCAQACSPMGSGCLALSMPAGAAFSCISAPTVPYPGVCRHGQCRQEPPQPALTGAGGWRGPGLPAQGAGFAVVSLQNSSACSLSPLPPFYPCPPPFPSCFLSLLQL